MVQLEVMIYVLLFPGGYPIRHLTAHSFLSAEIEAACLRMARLHISFGQSHFLLRCEPMGQRAQCKGEQTAHTKKFARML